MQSLIFVITMIALTRTVLATATTEERVSLDDHTFRQITVSLQDDAEALRQFLRLATEKETGGRVTPPVILVSEQISLTADDIRQRARDIDSTKVYEINLNDFNFTDEEARQRVVSYFREHNLCNLRVLNLRGSRGVSFLVSELFGGDRPKGRFISLFKVDAKDTGIKGSDLDTIFSYFSGSTCFYRDLKQVSVRYDVYGAFLVVEGVIGIDSIGTWQRGKKTDTVYDVHYLSSDENMKGPLIMRTES